MVDAIKSDIDKLLKVFTERHYTDTQTKLHAALSYALLGPGKRVRGQLAWLSCEALGKARDHANPAVIALEMVHAYSLVHDDLPCLDDDHLRRGRPTVHIAFDEATALLVGDALLTDAFRVLTDPTMRDTPISADLSAPLVMYLSRASGGHGMVAGQALDVHWTARPSATLADLESIHRKKTGRLLGAAAAMGALCGGASAAEAEQFQHFGEDVGLSFQIIDDLLDGEEETGKSKGKDEAQGKLTYVSLLGRDRARQLADSYTESAMARLQPYGDAAAPLKQLVCDLLRRKS